MALLSCATLVSQQPTGTVTGIVFDSQSGRAIPGVSIAVQGQAGDRHVTNSDGQFTISLAPGTYVLRLTAANYADVQVSDVIVKAGESTESSAVMSNKSLVTTVDVVEKASPVGATAEAMLTERKLSAVVSDSISREELASGTSSDAAGALEKVTGVSVVGDGFVYVRGLGERYSSTQLNGAVIPTTEPEKRVVPLDLFPTAMIDNVKIAKTYSPDLPAEFSGGLVQLQTIEFPPKKILSVSLKSGFNSASTFNRFFTSPGGAADYWGFGAGNRALPAAIPTDQRVIQGRFNQQELQAFGRAFSNSWEPTPIESQRPALDWSVTGGGTIGKFGIVGSLSFSNRPQFRSEFQRYLRTSGTTPIVATEYPDFREYSEGARLGGAFNVAYRVAANHKIVFRNTWTHDTDMSAREFAGYDGVTDSDVIAQRLRYIERNLLASGVEGEHVIPNWANSVLHWQFTYSASARNEPDLREVIRNVLPDGRQVFSSGSGSGIRFFSDLDDRIYEPQLDYSVPFFKGAVSGMFRTGFRTTVRRRDFQARRFRYLPQQLTTLNLFAPSNQLFGADNIRPTGFQIIEYTRGTDTYDASMDVYAGYAMVDLNLGKKWRLVGGFRVEDADQQVITIDNQVPNAAPVVASLRNRDPIPSLNAVYALSQRQNLRLSYSRTLSRPDFRELSPFDFNNVLGGFVTVGNANLKRASISNYDFRWEMFPGGSSLVAVSAFIKTFADPIEQTVIISNDLRQSFINAKGARNFGFELEYRHNLGALTPALRDFALSSNFTFVDSNIDIRPEDAAVLTSKSRALVGQSRYVFNGTFQWARPKWHSDARFFANYVSRRISDVGSYGLPDIYQEPIVSLDFAYQYTFNERAKWSLRFEAENLSNNSFEWTQGTFLQRQYRLGRTFQIGVNHSFF